MPEPEKSTLVQPPYRPATLDEVAAQRLIRYAAGKLRMVAMSLRGVRHSLPEVYTADEAEAMGENRAPQSLTFSLIGSMECILSDDIEPAIAALDEAGALTPAELFEEWQERQKEQEEKEDQR